MLRFVLVLPTGRCLDTADSPDKLDFSNLDGALRYEVHVCFDGSSDFDALPYLIATVDLTGCEDQADWTAKQLCHEIDFRMAIPSFEDEVRSASRPLITFGEHGGDSNDGTV